ncbi:MAG: hypothetical protein OXC60_05140, partial [Litoreibacter sp.]|nr:hypothetical protein [Litoreibacter sp.]
MSDFAGLSRDADEQLSTEHLDWADIVFVMETRQKKKLTSRFGPSLRLKRVIVLVESGRGAPCCRCGELLFSGGFRPLPVPQSSPWP